MNKSSESVAWFCIRTQPKHEQIAAAHLRRLTDIEVFSPKLRIRRATRRGAVWFVEALFPGYLFARFNWEATSQVVRGTPGVSSLVAFGTIVPIIPDTVIDDLRAQFDENESHEVPEAIQDGDQITIAGGPFHGLEATVLRVMSAKNRIQVLLEILGDCKKVEIPVHHVAQSDSKARRLGNTPLGRRAGGSGS